MGAEKQLARCELCQREVDPEHPRLKPFQLGLAHAGCVVCQQLAVGQWLVEMLQSVPVADRPDYVHKADKVIQLGRHLGMAALAYINASEQQLDWALAQAREWHIR